MGRLSDISNPMMFLALLKTHSHSGEIICRRCLVIFEMLAYTPLQPVSTCQNLKAIFVDIPKSEWLEMKVTNKHAENAIYQEWLQVKYMILLMDVFPNKGKWYSSKMTYVYDSTWYKIIGSSNTAIHRAIRPHNGPRYGHRPSTYKSFLLYPQPTNSYI